MHVAALLVLAFAAPAAVMGSALPEPQRSAFGALAGLYALVRARRLAVEPPAQIAWTGPGATAALRQTPCETTLHEVRVEFRGPLVRLVGRDAAGARRTVLWWPDTLSRADRRRLAIIARDPAATGNSLPSMAA